VCRYVLKLRGELEEGATQVFGGAGEREQVRSVLADLAKTSADFGALAAWALAAVASAVATRLRCGGISTLPFVIQLLSLLECSPVSTPSRSRPHGRPTLDALGPISYEASDLSGEDSSEAWVQGLAAALDAAMSRLQQLLTPKNYDALVSLVLTGVAKRARPIPHPDSQHVCACTLSSCWAR
jgi:hypothetical protein